ncbi:MAG: ABC transporter ATP-binding protein [bacterium]
MTTAPPIAVDIQGLHKIYQNRTVALSKIDLTIEQGSFFGLLGPNGAGKSTLIGILCGLITKSAGTVRTFGIDVDTEPLAARRFLGVVPQEFNFSIFEPCMQIICNHAGYYGVPQGLAKERANIYLKKLGLWDKRNQPAGTLSGGLKRRLMIVRALVVAPKLLILDEPTAGVDISIRHLLWEFLQELNEQGLSIILTTHYLEEAEKLCKHLAIMDKGEVLETGPTTTLLDSLKQETLLLFCQPFDPSPVLPDFDISIVSNQQLKVRLGRGQALGDLILALNQQNIRVIRTQNTANRLEELFLNLVTP